jgi:hypothetical protein
MALIVGGSVTTVGIVTGCVRGVHGGDPALPLSTTNGISVIILASEAKVLAGISNAFVVSAERGQPYRDMSLFPADVDPHFSKASPTNGFVLVPFGPTSHIPLSGWSQKVVPYFARMYINVRPIDAASSVITVRTLHAKVIDGEELGIHGGWAHHDREVRPVRIEEENVMLTISNAVVAMGLNGDKK